MKKLFYLVYRIFFNLGRLLPQNEKLVALVSPHNASFNDSLGEVKRVLEEKGDFEFLLISSAEIRGKASLFGVIRFFTLKAMALARAKYIFLNDNFMPMADLNFKKGTVITQLWHGEGALKKIGLHVNQPEEIKKRELRLYSKYTYLVCSSPAVVPIYAEAFNMPESRVLPLGSARTDALYRPFDYKAERAAFDLKYPECKGKKLAVYAPTFRDDPEKDGALMSHFDIDAFNRRFGDEYALIIRLHPQVHAPADLTGAVDATGYGNIGQLLQLCDLLITDYSSICMDFVLLRKPCIFYAFDLEYYNSSRSFYSDYRTLVPGKIAEDFPALLDAIADPELDEQKLSDFTAYHFGTPDGKAAERVVKAVMGI